MSAECRAAKTKKNSKVRHVTKAVDLGWVTILGNNWQDSHSALVNLNGQARAMARSCPSSLLSALQESALRQCGLTYRRSKRFFESIDPVLPTGSLHPDTGHSIGAGGEESVGNPATTRRDKPS